MVNQLLTFIDGAEDSLGGGVGQRKGGKTQIFLLAATNRPDMIDPALLRPGRIETHIYVGNPETSIDRYEILLGSVLACLGKEKSPSVDLLAVLATISSHPACSRLTSADLKALVTSSFLNAINDMVERGCEDEEINMTGRHMLDAFFATRPSIGDDDWIFYDGIYRQYRN